MGTLTINGHKVTVDDSFAKLSPADQERTVNEIAAQLPAAQPNPAIRAGQDIAYAGQYDNQAPAPNLLDSTLATINGITGSVPGLQQASDALLAGGQTIGDIFANRPGTLSQHYADIQKQREAVANKAPVADLAGSTAGALAGYGSLARVPGMAKALGFEGPFGQRVVNSGLSALGIGTADSLARGEKPTDALAENALPAAAAGALPVVGAGLRMALKGAGNAVRPIATAFNRENEVTKRLGAAIATDQKAGAAMTRADEAVAANSNIPVMNADRFGSATRGLARTAANISPDAKGQFVRTIEDRFKGQSGRAVDFVKGLMNGAVDDLGLHDQLRAAADKANSIAYGRAYSDPAARAVWTPEIKQLMQSDQFRAAISAAESRGTDKAAISGVKAVRNPFVFGPNGSVTLKTNPDGSRALPSLQFWNQVKINLDSAIDAAKPTPTNAGDRALYSDLTAMKQKLVGALDAAVPSYKAARSGASGFFGAEDAIDAGRKALGTRYQIPELERAYAKLNPAEKTAAAVGYASELVDRFKGSGDHRNFIGQFFDSPEARAKNELFLGPARARQLEAYVRVEGIVDQLRGAVTGNSTTAQQLIAAGVLGGAGGYFGSGGNIQAGMTAASLAALGRRGMQVLGKRVDEQVMQRIAEILVSQNPKELTRAIENAALSKAHMAALEAIYRGMNLTARAGIAGAAMAAAQ